MKRTPRPWERREDEERRVATGDLVPYVTSPLFSEQPAHDALATLKADCETKPDTEGGAAKYMTLADLPDPLPEDENPAALFRNGWLRKGGGAFLVSTSGTGKSVLTIQAALLWSTGRAAFGIEPVRPLKIAIIQAEDDAEEMADFRNQITDGLAESGIDPTETQEACKSIILADATGRVGESFIEFINGLLQERPEVDLLVVNPFQSYFGGDISRNAELSQFLRTWLDPLIKPARAGVLFVHHTNKPPSAKDRDGWGTDGFAAYIGAGGAELVNWARAMLALMPVENVPGVFRLVAGKRGRRLDWRDGEGNKTLSRFFAHSDKRIFWRGATPEEIEAATQGKGGGRQSYDPEQDARQLADKLRVKPLKLSDVRKLAEQLCGRTRGRKAFDCLKDNPGAFGLSMVQADWKACVFVGTRAETEAAARDFDAQMRATKSNKGVLPE
ncbi:MAG TPA: AAA family ATPase [Kiritimatiellia bacterium]|nr:AAA family ATPase [Kiritimatiellia bacterium]